MKARLTLEMMYQLNSPIIYTEIEAELRSHKVSRLQKNFRIKCSSVMRGKTRHLSISLVIKKHESKFKYFFHNEYVK